MVGCVSIPLPAENCEPRMPPPRTVVEQTSTALLATEPGVGELLWLEVERPSGARTVGGYLAESDEPRGGLILLLTGASTLEPAGRREAARKLYDNYGYRLGRAGFSVWSLVLSEDTPYWADEVGEVVDAVDWLDDDGRAFLGVERVYLVGYSTGATTANLVNLERDVTAVVSLGGLTQGDQLVVAAELYRWINGLFPCNTGIGQLGQTVESLSRQTADPLDVVSRVAEIRNPTLFVHAIDDIIHSVANARDLERAYLAERDAGNTTLPPLTFDYLAEGGHFGYVTDPERFSPVLDYLNAFEPD
jgi:pimeloyl-ACP methyl ester carboxylesterase